MKYVLFKLAVVLSALLLPMTSVRAAAVEANFAAIEEVASADEPEWFPALAAEPDLTLAQPPVKLTTIQSDLTGHGHNTLIPLPPAAWTGLAGLGTLAAIGWRKAALRFLS
jgi:hypothetical protein